MAKAQKDFRWSGLSLASWQWEQSCPAFSAFQFDHANHFPLAFPGGRLSLQVRSFIFVVGVACGVLLFSGFFFFFFFIWSFVCLLKQRKMFFRQLLGFPWPVQ